MRNYVLKDLTTVVIVFHVVITTSVTACKGFPPPPPSFYYNYHYRKYIAMWSFKTPSNFCSTVYFRLVVSEE